MPEEKEPWYFKCVLHDIIFLFYSRHFDLRMVRIQWLFDDLIQIPRWRKFRDGTFDPTMLVNLLRHSGVEPEYYRYELPPKKHTWVALDKVVAAYPNGEDYVRQLERVYGRRG